jgi:hypothetical protein
LAGAYRRATGEAYGADGPQNFGAHEMRIASRRRVIKPSNENVVPRGYEYLERGADCGSGAVEQLGRAEIDDEEPAFSRLRSPEVNVRVGPIALKKNAIPDGLDSESL